MIEAVDGTADFTLYNVPADVAGTITPGGAAVPVTLSTSGQDASLTFSGTTNQRVSLAMSGSTFGYYIGVTIKKPDGTTLVTSSFFNASQGLKIFSRSDGGNASFIVFRC